MSCDDSESYQTKLKQGATWSRTITWKTGTPAVPVILTGYTARMQLRRAAGEAVAVELTTENGRITLGGITGEIALSIDAVTTAALTPARYAFDLELVSGAAVTCILEGFITVTPNITV